MKVTLGGDRLGSGNKNKQELHNYFRSTHNLSQRWTSSMAAGILYPFLVLPAMRGDKFEIDIEAAARTIPTQGPLFGSFKMQVDIFKCPMRLYQAILHNNPTEIGLKMSNVKLPKIEIHTKTYKGEKLKGLEFSNSCLMKYLGISGLGQSGNTNADDWTGRRFNAIPALAYYDIFKTYYSNKQEENAYVIGPVFHAAGSVNNHGGTINWGEGPKNYRNGDFLIWWPNNLFEITLRFHKEPEISDIENTSYFVFSDGVKTFSMSPIDLNSEEMRLSQRLEKKDNYWEYSIQIDAYKLYTYLINEQDFAEVPYDRVKIESVPTETTTEVTNLNLIPFNLKNIDDMRMAILSHNNMGTPFLLQNNSATADGKWGRADGSDQTGLPYSLLFDRTGAGHDTETFNLFALNGLCVKTYQSDLFNNWINTEWIDGENGIAAITAISTASGDKFTIDSLNLAEKLYNMLNRIAVSGATYEDWQDAVYCELPKRHLESPMYLGGMSSEVVFEEIVQTAPADTTDGSSTLGTLGGRGVLIKRKGGNVSVKVDEPSFIIGIVSLTPRLMYTQGNEFYMTDLDSIDDLHKPALDGIGFQNLIGERLAWFDTTCRSQSDTPNIRHTIGKVPAWIEYMTAVDKAYGDFLDQGAEGSGFMILNRRYEHDDTNGGIKDATTYIDPQKYNYAFAYQALDAQNFWVQIQSNIKARRLMSAKQIPNI